MRRFAIAHGVPEIATNEARFVNKVAHRESRDIENGVIIRRNPCGLKNAGRHACRLKSGFAVHQWNQGKPRREDV